MKPIKSKEIFSLKILIIWEKEKKKVLGTRPLQGISGDQI